MHTKTDSVQNTDTMNFSEVDTEPDTLSEAGTPAENNAMQNFDDTPQSADKPDESQIGYPDISRADTKIIVILSLIFVLVIFLLSIFLPAKITETDTAPAAPKKDTSLTPASIPTIVHAAEASNFLPVSTTVQVAEASNTNTPATVQATDCSLSAADCCFTSSLLIFDADTGFATDNQKIYYYGQSTTPHTGWLELADGTYYFDEDGIMCIGWTTIGNKQFYFNEQGILQKNRWIIRNEIITPTLHIVNNDSASSCVYVNNHGEMLTNTVTPDGTYVDETGFPDTRPISLATSKEGFIDLKNELEMMIDGYSGTWSVYVKNIAQNQYLQINNVQHFSASLIKLYCGAAIFDLIDSGELEETEYIDNLMHAMISISDNDAFNLLVMQCDTKSHSHINGRGVIQSYIDAHGYHDTTITSMLVPTRYKAPSSPGRNYTTAVDCGLLLEAIYKRQCVSKSASEQYLNLLFRQVNTSKIPAGLPDGTRCANKTGDTDEVQHDAAIVYSPNGVYIICVMSSGSPNAINNIGNISKTVYEYFN